MVEINSLLNVVLLALTTTTQTLELVTKLSPLFCKNHFSITIDFIHIEMLRVLRLSKPCNTHFLNSFLLLEMLFIARVD